VLFEPTAQRLASQKFHHDVGGTDGSVAKLEDLHQAGMVDDVDGARLVEKARQRVLVFG
jgi:hypothetical protein